MIESAKAEVTLHVTRDAVEVVCTAEGGEITLSSVKATCVLGSWASVAEAVVSGLQSLVITIRKGAEEGKIPLRKAQFLGKPESA